MIEFIEVPSQSLNKIYFILSIKKLLNARSNFYQLLKKCPIVDKTTFVVTFKLKD